MDDKSCETCIYWMVHDESDIGSCSKMLENIGGKKITSCPTAFDFYCKYYKKGKELERDKIWIGKPNHPPDCKCPKCIFTIYHYKDFEEWWRGERPFSVFGINRYDKYKRIYYASMYGFFAGRDRIF